MTVTTRRRKQEELLDLPPATEIPIFSSEAEEAEFWATHDTSLLWDQGEDVTNSPPPNLRRRPPGVESTARKRPPDGRMDLVSIRLPVDLIDGVKAVAARRHLPYQTLMRSWIAERLEREQRADLAGEARSRGET
jgi:hypothetical protein